MSKYLKDLNQVNKLLNKLYFLLKPLQPWHKFIYNNKKIKNKVFFNNIESWQNMRLLYSIIARLSILMMGQWCWMINNTKT